MLTSGMVFMIDNVEEIAKDILEISSEQRLKIILKLVSANRKAVFQSVIGYHNVVYVFRISYSKF